MWLYSLKGIAGRGQFDLLGGRDTVRLCSYVRWLAQGQFNFMDGRDTVRLCSYILVGWHQASLTYWVVGIV